MKATHTRLADVAVTPAVILRGAADYLTRYGWGQRSFYGPERPFPTACALAAIHIAATGRPTSNVPAEHREDITGAVCALADYLDETWHGYYGRYSLNPRSVIEDFNDYYTRTAAEVVDALTTAADEWDTRNHRGGETS